MSKIARPFCLVAGLVFALASGCGGGDDDSPGSACMKFCAVSTTLKCPNDPATGCEASCEAAVNAFPNCKSQFTAALACAGNQPASNWMCDADGEANPKDGVCDAEGLAAAACLLGGPKK
jgi:hypothetical protein